MKKIITTLLVALFALSIPLTSQADTSYGAMEKQLAALAADQADRSALQEDYDYNYGAIIAYYTVDAYDRWWTTLAIYNTSSGTNNMLVGCLDTDGVAAAVGQLSAASGTLTVDEIGNLITAGSVPDVGTIAVFGTGSFIVNRSLGSDLIDGFSEIQMDGEPY